MFAGELGISANRANSSVIQQVVDSLLMEFDECHLALLSIIIETWLQESDQKLISIERYNEALAFCSSQSSQISRVTWFISLLVCFAMDFNASVEDVRDAFACGEDDCLLFMLILYVQLFVARMRGPAYFTVKCSYILENFLHCFCTAAKELINNQAATLLAISPGSPPNALNLTATPISLFLIYNILYYFVPQSKPDRFKLYHAQVQHIPYLLIGNAAVSLDLRYAMVDYSVENKIVWEKDVSSDDFLINVFKPCLNGICSIVAKLDMQDHRSAKRLLNCITLIYLLLETYDIERLFRILGYADQFALEGFSNNHTSYFGFTDTIATRSMRTKDTSTKALVRTCSVSNLHTHSLDMPSGGNLQVGTSFTTFIDTLLVFAKLIYTNRDALLKDPYVFQESCRLLYCSTSVLLFSLLTCLGNLPQRSLPPALPNFNYVLRCGLLFASEKNLKECSEIEYQAACLLFHLANIAQAKLEFSGFIADKLPSIRGILLRPVTNEGDLEYNKMMCSYFGLSITEADSIAPLPIIYAADGSLYSSSSSTKNTISHDTFYLSFLAPRDLTDFNTLQLYAERAIEFIINNVSQYEEAILSGYFYVQNLTMRILDPQFSILITIITECLSCKKQSANDFTGNIDDIFSAQFVRSIVMLLYAYSNCYFNYFLVKSDILYHQHYNLLFSVTQLLLDLLFQLPHETTLLALLYRPGLCLLPTALLSIFKALSYPKKIHLHMPLLLLVVDLMREFFCRLTKYKICGTDLPTVHQCEIFNAVTAMASNESFASTVIAFIEELIISGWASIGRAYSILVESLLSGFIEYLHISPIAARLLAQNCSIAEHIIQILWSTDAQVQVRTSSAAIKTDANSHISSLNEHNARIGITLHITAHVLEILISLFMFYYGAMINFIKEARNTGVLNSIMNIFLSSTSRLSYSRCRHLPFLSYIYIYANPNKAIAHKAGTLLWLSANYYLWASPFLYGFLTALLILRANRCSFGLFSLLLHQLFVGFMSRNPLDRLHSFPSASQLRSVLMCRPLFQENTFVAEYCEPYTQQLQIEPFICCCFAINYFLTQMQQQQRPLSTWQSIQVLAMPSLSIQNIVNLCLPDALFDIYENEVQTKRTSYIYKLKKLLKRALCIKNAAGTKSIQPFLTSCNLSGHLNYIIRRSQQNLLLPLMLLFIVLSSTCHLKNWIYEISGWAAAYGCINIFLKALGPLLDQLPTFLNTHENRNLRYQYLRLLVGILEEITLNSGHSIDKISFTTGVLHLFYNRLQLREKNGSPSTLYYPTDSVYFEDKHFMFNLGAIFAVRSGYLQLLLSLLPLESMMDNLTNANISPPRLIFLISALLENLWYASEVPIPDEIDQSFSITASSLRSTSRPLIVKILTEICGLVDECEYFESILSCECGVVPNFVTFRLLAHEPNKTIHQANKMRTGHRHLTSTKLEASSLQVGMSHVSICNRFSCYFNEHMALRWILDNDWGFFHVAQSSNIALCTKICFEHYYLQVESSGFTRFLKRLSAYLRLFFKPINTNMQAFHEKGRQYRSIFSQIETNCSDPMQTDTNLMLIDLIINTLHCSLTETSTMSNTLSLVEILAYVSSFSEDVSIDKKKLRQEDLQILAIRLQIALQSYDPREVIQGAMTTYALLANVSNDTDNLLKIGKLVSKSMLSTVYDSVLIEDVGLKLLFCNEKEVLPLSLPSLLISAVKFILDRDSWPNYIIVSLVQALIQHICSQQYAFCIFITSLVCFDFLENITATNMIKSNRTKINLVRTIARAMGMGSSSIPMPYMSDTSFQLKHDVLILGLQTVFYKLKSILRVHALSDSGIIEEFSTELSQIETISEVKDLRGVVRQILGGKNTDKDDGNRHEKLVLLIDEYCSSHCLPLSRIYLDYTDTIITPNQMTSPNLYTSADHLDGSLVSSL